MKNILLSEFIDTTVFSLATIAGVAEGLAESVVPYFLVAIGHVFRPDLIPHMPDVDLGFIFAYSVIASTRNEAFLHLMFRVPFIAKSLSKPSPKS